MESVESEIMWSLTVESEIMWNQTVESSLAKVRSVKSKIWREMHQIIFLDNNP